MKQPGWIPLAGALALSLAACSGGGGGGGQMFVQTCSLGCTSGEGGKQVSCGIVNTFQNQEVALLFSSPVQFSSVSKQSFRVTDSAGGTPPGNYLIDPGNPRRLIFRPKLSFNSQGQPQFGFQDGASYQVRVPGTAQGDVGPFVRSTGGRPNQSRVLCTITTDQGIIDPVPGAPSVQMFVDVLDPMTNMLIEGVPAAGASNVATTSDLTFVFDDVMNVGTIVVPATGLAPFITILVDGDGDLSDPSDQTPVGGSFTFNVDQVNLVTTAIFTPNPGFPSLGPDPNKPRTILVTVPPSVRDLAGNAVANSGTISFTPQALQFPEATLPPGGEQFVDDSNEDADHSGADWGDSQPGRLKPGIGGGSGRMGDLVVKSGQTVTLATSPLKATGSIAFSANPANNATVTINGVVFTFKNAPTSGVPTDVQRRQFLSYSLAELEQVLNNSADPQVAEASYSVRTSDTLVVTYKVAGTDINGGDGMPFTLAASATSNGQPSGPMLTGGLDEVTFAGPETITNFDFQANPGGDPPPIVVDDGVFEFGLVEVRNNGTLRLVGDNPGRILARGRFTVQSLGVVDASAADVPAHRSDNPEGQAGGAPGPKAGAGGRGGDRHDAVPELVNLFGGNNPGSGGMGFANGVFSAGVVNPGSIIVGSSGQGVGNLNIAGQGIGGDFWPHDNDPSTPDLPTGTTQLNALEVNIEVSCASQQVGGPGGGAAYATDGGDGVPMANFPLSTQGGSNTPPNTAGAQYAATNLEPPGAPPVKRKLTPKFGYLLGGSGGGGAGLHTTGTIAVDLVNPCTSLASALITHFYDHSGAAGGGGGGALQIVGGRRAQIDGILDASGGAGGSSAPAASAPVNAREASPGGGGSGGAILLQSQSTEVAFNPNRLSVVGGNGGTGTAGSTGGKGGAGLIRAEGLNALDLTTLASSVNPFFNVPDQTNVNDPMAAIHWLSVGTWDVEQVVPESFSGSQSCWMRPTGSFFELDFLTDGGSDFGWNMDVILQMGASTQTVAYRGSSVFGGLSPQEHWGELLAVDLGPGETGAPVVVRFQGAKSVGSLGDLCNLDPNDPNGPIQVGSLTPWVRHPAELNEFNPRPDMVRFLVIFDASHLDIPVLRGVTNLAIRAQPN